MHPSGRRRPLRQAAAAAVAAVSAVALVATATPAQAVVGTPDTLYAFTARITVGDVHRGCSGALVDREWLLTAASCFAEDPAADLTVPAGRPARGAVARIGGTDLPDQRGEVRTIVELVPRNDRDVVLARLSRPVTGIAPVAIGTTAPVVGEELRIAGHGRTAQEWSPETLHAGAFGVDAVTGYDVGVSGRDGAAVCAGDAGGPALRQSAAGPELVALSSRSYQGGCYGVETPAGTPDTAVGTRVDDLRGWIDGQVGAPRITDFDCDGTEDVAIADPEAAVGGDAKAGLARVAYGGGRAAAEITQDMAAVPDSAEPNDRFGHALATYDQNEDGCTDLVVGTPYEDVGTVADAGTVSVLYGAPGGLTTGKASFDYVQGTGSGDFAVTVSEAGDRMGAALAAGHTAAGEPYLVIGVPGEDIESGGTVAVDAGAAYYVRGAVSKAVNQNQPGLAGGAEAGDDFGASLAATPQHIAIGVPGEGIGSYADAGGLQLLEHTVNADGMPNPLPAVNQDLDYVSGGAEPGDRFAEAVAGVAYRPAGSAAATDSMFSVGSPGEDTTVNGVRVADAGWVATLRVTAAGVTSQHTAIVQGYADVAGGPENGDRFGAELAAANLAPRAVSDAFTLELAVGSPGEDLSGLVDAGAVQTFALTETAPGASDGWIQPGNTSGLPGSLGAGQQVGSSLHATGGHLYVGLPYGPSPHGAAHALPWANARAWPGTSPVTSYEPGKGGLPAAGLRFGWAMQ